MLSEDDTFSRKDNKTTELRFVRIRPHWWSGSGCVGVGGGLAGSERRKAKLFNVAGSERRKAKLFNVAGSERRKANYLV